MEKMQVIKIQYCEFSKNICRWFYNIIYNIVIISLARTHTCICCNRRSWENRTQSSQDGDSGVFLPPVAGNRDTQTTRLCEWKCKD